MLYRRGGGHQADVAASAACPPTRHIDWENIMDRRLHPAGPRHAPVSPRRPCQLLACGFGLVAAMAAVQSLAQEPCGGQLYPFPYTDVSGVGAPFCPGIMEAYVTGVSKGTTPTTFSPNNNVTRVQMTTFLQRSLDQGLTRASRRAAFNQWWTPQNSNAMQMIAIGGIGQFCAADGGTIWVTNYGNVLQIDASTGKVLGTWTGANNSAGIVVAAGKVFVGADDNATVTTSSLYVIDPTEPPGPLTAVSTNVGELPLGMAFDGTHVWTANNTSSVSIIDPTSPYTVTTVSTGFVSPAGIVFDGAHIWVTDNEANALYKLSPTGAIQQTVTTGVFPEYPAFDGTNIWVPNYTDSTITVVQASTGNIVATIVGDLTNNVNNPFQASFDGERILVTNFNSGTVSIFKAADLSFIANVAAGVRLGGVCNDGISFWLVSDTGTLFRF
jgi:hypothetical protein